MSKVLTLDYEFEHDYNLLGITSTLEGYRLAYLLNKNLEIYLERQSNNIDFTNKNCSFSLYNYECNRTFSSWSLIANKHIFVSKNIEETNLFNEESKISYLINEKKEVDYFLKIIGDFNSSLLKQMLENIKNIKGLIAAYTINPHTLKSKDYLIF
jgi:hypothetical protein